jgi:hypothetical protein
MTPRVLWTSHRPESVAAEHPCAGRIVEGEQEPTVRNPLKYQCLGLCTFSEMARETSLDAKAEGHSRSLKSFPPG